MTQDADTNDSREGEGAGDPVAAFDALRFSVEAQGQSLAREMADLRRGVEAVFEGIDAIGHRPDYSVDLARIMKSLDRVSGQLQAIQDMSSPVEIAAEQYVKRFEKTGAAMLGAAMESFRERAREIRAGTNEWPNSVA